LSLGLLVIAVCCVVYTRNKMDIKRWKKKKKKFNELEESSFIVPKPERNVLDICNIYCNTIYET